MSSTKLAPVLILGANSDIGRAIAHAFAEKGYPLQLAARNVERLVNDVSDYAIRYGVEALLYEFDARNWQIHQAFYDSLDPKPGIVICVFGFYPDQERAEVEPELLRETLETNFLGAVSILQISANYMQDRGEGTLVGISSVAGDRGRAKNYIYGSAKAGFSAFLSGLRNRLHNSEVHVLTVKPGFVYTAMTEGMDLPPSLTAKPEQVAKDVFRAVKKKKNVLYSRWMWRYIMLIIKNIPEVIFKRLDL
ncbi:MAG: SDR family oxidoreductase [Bacteroidota bacterium]